MSARDVLLQQKCFRECDLQGHASCVAIHEARGVKFSPCKHCAEYVDANIAALRAAGCALVPVEPTEAMLRAAHDGPLMAGDHVMEQKQREWLSEMWSADFRLKGTAMTAMTLREKIARQLWECEVKRARQELKAIAKRVHARRGETIKEVT
jgi:hypothetical protein